jgi:hypothetical protein
MWKLDRPSIQDVKSELDIGLGVGMARQPIIPTDAEKAALWVMYEEFELSLGRPKTELEGNALRPAFLQAVHDAYKQVQDNGDLAELRNALKLGATECPYCGFGQIQDLDHHLPKGAYKLFSIFPLNLVPSCATCNRGKPRKPNPDAAKDLLNVYLEDSSKHDFFIAAATIDPGTGALDIQFKIAFLKEMDGELHSRLTHHIDSFKLQNRLRAQVNIYLGSLEVSIQDQFLSGGGNAVEDYLRRSSEANSRRFGRNDWRTAVLRGLASCREFCHGGFAKALGHP